jgi:hypothetical protein
MKFIEGTNYEYIGYSSQLLKCKVDCIINTTRLGKFLYTQPELWGTTKIIREERAIFENAIVPKIYYENVKPICISSQ